jgi:hypothetical protein
MEFGHFIEWPVFGFVSGHGFSRAAADSPSRALAPAVFSLANLQGLKPRFFWQSFGTAEAVP